MFIYPRNIASTREDIPGRAREQLECLPRKPHREIRNSRSLSPRKRLIRRLGCEIAAVALLSARACHSCSSSRCSRLKLSVVLGGVGDAVGCAADVSATGRRWRRCSYPMKATANRTNITIRTTRCSFFVSSKILKRRFIQSGAALASLLWCSSGCMY